MHVLDNPVWHALTGAHAAVAEREALAARYVPGVSVFAALPDDVTPDAWEQLRTIVGPGGHAFLARRMLASIPEGWTVAVESPCRQMVSVAPNARELDDASSADVTPLAAGDVPEMLALVEHARPGPFAPRTIELGRYLGIRDPGGRLVAMAGERMHPTGFTEISAVCTDEAHRGRGLASRLVNAIARGVRERGETPFLHLTMENEPARRVYGALGFETRTELTVFGLRAPA